MQTFYLVDGRISVRRFADQRPWHKTKPTIFTEQTIKQKPNEILLFFSDLFFLFSVLAAAVRSHVVYELWGNTVHTWCFQSTGIFRVWGNIAISTIFVHYFFVFGVGLWSEFPQDVPISHAQICKMWADVISQFLHSKWTSNLAESDLKDISTVSVWGMTCFMINFLAAVRNDK